MSEQSISANHGAAISARAKVQVRFSEKANIETITNVIARIGDRYGCRACGLLGVDLNLSGDPKNSRKSKSFQM